MKNRPRSEIHIRGIKHVEPHAEAGRILVRADTLIDNASTELEIAVTTDLAPAMALALLSTTARARAARDELDPALAVLGAAVVRSSLNSRVRLQLLFEKGAVLPVELTIESAKALNDGLTEYLGSSRRRLAPRRDGTGEPND